MIKKKIHKKLPLLWNNNSYLKIVSLNYFSELNCHAITDP